MKYFTIKYWIEQINLGNLHYEKILQQVVPPSLYSIYRGFNKKLSLFLLPLFIFYSVNSIFPFFSGTFINLLESFIFFFIFYFGVWELIISRYTLPKWKLFIVRNSPLEEAASALSLIRMIKSPAIGICIGCFGIALGVNNIHKQLWPDSISPGQRLGNSISNITGYNPPKK